MANTIPVTDQTFEEEVLKSDIPVLVDFWAEWCGPCKMIAPILEELSTEYEGKIKIAKVDVDSNAEKAGQYGVRGIPTLLIFKDGVKENSERLSSINLFSALTAFSFNSGFSLCK